MTGAEMLAELKLMLGNQSWGLTDIQLYTALTRQKEIAERKFPFSFRASVACKTTASSGTITLNSTNLELTTGHTCLGVFEYGIRWDDNIPMVKTDKNEIDLRRDRFGQSGGTDPWLYALPRVLDVLTLEVWPDFAETIAVFADAKLKLDIVEKTTAINASTDCALPEYSHLMTVMRTAYKIAGDFNLRDIRFRFRTKDRFRPGELDTEEQEVAAKANDESSGPGRMSRSIIY